MRSAWVNILTCWAWAGLNECSPSRESINMRGITSKYGMKGWVVGVMAPDIGRKPFYTPPKSTYCMAAGG